MKIYYLWGQQVTVDENDISTDENYCVAVTESGQRYYVKRDELVESEQHDFTVL